MSTRTSKLFLHLVHLRNAAQLRQVDISKLTHLGHRTITTIENPEARGSRVPKIKTLRSYCAPLNLSKGEWIDILAMWCIEALGDESRLLRIEPVKATAEFKTTAANAALASAAFSQLPPRDQHVILQVLEDTALLHAAHTLVNLRNR